MVIHDINSHKETPPTTQELLQQIALLRQEVESLREERDELELKLQIIIDHADTITEDLIDSLHKALDKSAKQFRMLIRATPVPVLISRVQDGQIMYANTIAGPLFGLSSQRLKQHRTLEFYHNPDDRTALFAQLEQQGEIDRYELRLKKIDGALFWAEVSLRRLIFEDEPSLLIAVHDITERKQAAEALQTAVDELTKINQASSRFVPSAFLEFLQKQSIVDIRLGDHVSREMTVMFSDIRSFTALSEEMNPQENFDFVNAYLKRVSPIAYDHRGFIVKYVGDGLMAIFPEQADDAIRGGIEMLNRVAAYNAERCEYGRQAIQIGIGINTGHMMVGMVGDENRFQGDAFSDNVNLTSRVESLTKFYGISFIITEATYNKLTNPGDYHIRFVDKVQVKGRSEAIRLYEIFDADLPEQRELKCATSTDYEEAMRLYYAHEFAEAQARLFGVLQRNPKDKVAWHHLVQATRLLDEGVTDNWTGVTVMTMK